MKEIIILEEAPTILTKDVGFVRGMDRQTNDERGRIILLPEDAVLLKREIIIGVEENKD